MSNFQNPTAPLPGGHICRTHLAFHKEGWGNCAPARVCACARSWRILLSAFAMWTAIPMPSQGRKAILGCEKQMFGAE
jgi:hypothetical protein